MRRMWVMAVVLAVATTGLTATVGAQSPNDRQPQPTERGAASLSGMAPDAQGKVTVRVDVDRRANANANASVAAAGGTVLDSRGSVLEVELPAQAVEALSKAPGVVSVRPFIDPKTLGDVSQGVDSTNASAWHDLGVVGAGVKVAIIDFGFVGYQDAIASNDLPSNVTPKNYCSTGLNSLTPHGTGVAEIVHDVAPQAQLYLICVDNVIDLENAVDYAILQGIDIINHSGAWFLADRGDGSSTVDPSPSNAVRRADQAGIMWVAAAGNYAENHWKGDWRPIDLGVAVFQEFGTAGSGDFDLSTVVAPGQTIEVYLKWDNWPTTSTEDLDLFLFDLSGYLTSSEVDQSDPQNPREPTEALFWTNTSSLSRTVFIEVREWVATNPGELDLLVFSNAFLEHPVPAGSIADPAFSPHTVAVGASCFANNQIEDFSSLGPTIDGRIKPDFTSADAVTTRAYGGSGTNACDGFGGTSAAAPHLAGLAALIKEAAPRWSNDRIEQAMVDYSVDLGPGGMDNTFGHGDVVLGALPAEECNTLTAPVFGIAGPGTVVDSFDGSTVDDGAYVSAEGSNVSLCLDPGGLGGTLGVTSLFVALPAEAMANLGSVTVRPLPARWITE